MAKIAEIEEENLLNDLVNLNEIFRKSISCNNIKSHKSQGETGMGGQINTFLGLKLVCSSGMNTFSKFHKLKRAVLQSSCLYSHFVVVDIVLVNFNCFRLL